MADSGSTDTSLQMLSERFPQVRTIPLGQNYGFTGGYNRALGQILESPCPPEYMVLINSDIDVPSGWLEPLVDWMDRHPDCAACGPKLHALVLDDKTRTWERTDRFEYAGAAGGFLAPGCYPYCRGRILRHVAKDKGQFDSANTKVQWVSGACLMVRSSVWKSIGGLDERFFAHMEEIDWCWRARRAGYSVCVVPQSVVWHIGGGTLPSSSPFKLKLNFRNSLLMMHNNLPEQRGKFLAALAIDGRIILDRIAMLLFIVIGNWKSAAAVRDAHREYRQMKGSK